LLGAALRRGGRSLRRRAALAVAGAALRRIRGLVTESKTSQQRGQASSREVQQRAAVRAARHGHGQPIEALLVHANLPQ
jgi:hypothetical protein